MPKLSICKATATALFLALSAPHAMAQSGSLLADQITLDQSAKSLVAIGNVQVFYDGAILKAQHIVYNQTTDRIQIIGDFSITRGDKIEVYAQNATIDADLKTALLNTVRAVIEQSLRISAESAQIGKTESNFQTVIASTCRVCADQPTPVWQLRAKSVRHSADQQRVYLKDSILELVGVPVFYTPAISFPEPGVKRATGLLAPSFSVTNNLGANIKLPYYFALTPHSDLTLTPFLTVGGSAILEGEYRRRTKTGAYQIEGALAAYDSINSDGISAYIKSDGAFNVGGGFVFDYGIHLTSENFDKSTEDGFLENYGYSDEDRLLNFARLSKTTATRYIEATTSSVQSLRAVEPDTNIPIILPKAYYHESFHDDFLPGKFDIEAQLVSLQRFSAGAAYTLGARADWSHSWIAPNGLIFGLSGEATATAYSSSIDTGVSFLPSLTAEIRFPLQKTVMSATHYLEPIIQLTYAPDTPWGSFNSDITTNDSIAVEFEETNLFSTNRFPGFDTTETGLRANIGLNYQIYDPTGWELGATIGRVLRASDLNQFDSVQGAGLEDKNSDYVAAMRLRYRDTVAIGSRLLFDQDLNFSKNETKIGAKYGKVSGELSYVNLAIDPIEKQQEVTLSATYQHSDSLSFYGSTRHNLISDQPIEDQLGLKFINDCAKLSLALGREYDGFGGIDRSISAQIELGSFGGQTSKQKFKQRCGG